MARNERDVENLITAVKAYIEGIYNGDTDARLDANIDKLEDALDRVVGEREGWVYVFRILESNVVKIGFTARNPEERLAEVQAGLPHPLEIATVIRGSEKLERELHEEFARFRLRGEWFLAEDDLAIWLENRNARGFGSSSSTISNPFPWQPGEVQSWVWQKRLGRDSS